jgi:hypothetical protein
MLCAAENPKWQPSTGEECVVIRGISARTALNGQPIIMLRHETSLVRTDFVLSVCPRKRRANVK